MTLQLNVALIHRHGSFTCLAYFFTYHHTYQFRALVCATWHWQTSGQLVQELNVCTVGVNYSHNKAPTFFKALFGYPLNKSELSTFGIFAICASSATRCGFMPSCNFQLPLMVMNQMV